MSLYIVIEKFKNGDAARGLSSISRSRTVSPAGLSHVSSWVTDQLDR